ncbi:hypothetical protein LWI28_018887 [Acer negundo]|uniref:Uncharacterized protein n=1 Tax=Acer negundo TaxID=4023 RepID=A0AAD5NJ87_ACENE|nr:hypothetical protein LWI28_018887 [Acer negundo]
MSSKASLSSPPHSSSVTICGEGMISSSGGVYNLSTGLSSSPVLGISSAPILSSTCISLSGPFSIVVGSIPFPLPDVPIVQQVCSLLPHEVSPPPSVVVSSGDRIMESLSSRLSFEDSSPPSVVVSLGGSVMESLLSGDPWKLMPETAANPSGLVIVAVANAFPLSSTVYIAANISGGHVNPAVTLAKAVGGHISVLTALFYWGKKPLLAK